MYGLEPRAWAADRSFVRLLRARKQDGFGLIELLMAMTILNIGLLALVAAFNSGAVSLRRASKVSTAAALADTQMELYRALTYTRSRSTPGRSRRCDNTYKCDASLGVSCPNTITTCALTTCADGNVPVRTCTVPATSYPECLPSRTVTATLSPDHYPYRVDSYITFSTPTNGRQLKKITVVVRDGNLTSKVFARQTSTFDPSTSG